MPAGPDIPTFAIELSTWLLAHTTRKRPLHDVIDELATRLLAAEIPVRRLRTSVNTKHPEIFVRAVLWKHGAGARVSHGRRELLGTRTFLESPVAKVRAGASKIRCRLAGPDADLSFDICRELAEEGLTDYVVYPLSFSTDEGTYVSFATDHEAGFDDGAFALFEALLPVLSVRVEVESTAYALDSLLRVYLGPNAAKRVLAGEFMRGTGQPIEAAVWYCDMRGFTNLADQRPAAEVVRILDRFFECVAGPIAPNGGEVLKFIGDAVLAIFPVGEDGPRAACARALSAASAALQNIRALAGEGTLPAIDLGIALHVGEVMYGNIGARDRLDFTVIGAVVNEVCRVEALCRTLASPVLLTAAFASHCAPEKVVSRGVHALKGVAAPQEVFAPLTDAPSS